MSDQLQHMTKVMASVVRDNMEGFHCKHLTDSQMRELNPLIRQAIYTTLLVTQKARQGDKRASEWVAGYGRRALEETEWEDSIPMDGFLEAVSSTTPRTAKDVYPLLIEEMFTREERSTFPRLRYNLEHNGIKTVGQLMSLSPAEIIEFKNVGSKTFVEMLLWTRDHWGTDLQELSRTLVVTTQLGLQLFGEESTDRPVGIRTPWRSSISSDKLRALIQAKDRQEKKQ